MLASVLVAVIIAEMNHRTSFARTTWEGDDFSGPGAQRESFSRDSRGWDCWDSQRIGAKITEKGRCISLALVVVIGLW